MPATTDAATPRWTRAELAFAIGLAAVHALLLALVLGRHLDLLFNDAMHRLGPGTDFFAYYNAGRGFRLGEGIYGQGPGFGFRYHPLAAIAVGAPLSLLPPQAAYGVWVALHEVLLWVALACIARLLPDRRERLGAAALLVAFSPWYLEAYMGNASFLVAALLLVAFELERTGRARAAGAVFAASVVLKPLGLVFVPLLLARGRWLFVALLAAALVVSAVPYFRGDPDGWDFFVRLNATSVPAPGWVIHAGAQGLHALLADLAARTSGLDTSRLATLDALPAPWRAVLAGLPLALAAVALAVTLRARERVGLAVFAWSAVYLLGYKDVWEHSYSFLVLGLPWLRRERAVPQGVFLASVVLLALPTAFAIYDVPQHPGPNDPEHDWRLGVALLHHATKPLPVAVLFAATAWAAFTRPRATS